MASSRKGVCLRLRNAALDLYAERGFDRTTAAEIAALAGVTERTFFRHFPDKREVLFDGQAAWAASVADAVRKAPAGLPPLATLFEAFLSIVPMFGSERALKERRDRVISATPELHERELAKLSQATDAIAAALEDRAVPGTIASLAASFGMAVLVRARIEWLGGSPRRYPALLTDSDQRDHRFHLAGLPPPPRRAGRHI